MRAGDPVGATYWFERAVADLGPSPALLLKLAEAAMARGDRDRARLAVDEGLSLDGGHAGLRALARTLTR